MGFYEYLPPSYHATGRREPVARRPQRLRRDRRRHARGHPATCCSPASRGSSTSAAGRPTGRSWSSRPSTSRSRPASTSRRARRRWNGSCNMLLQHARNHRPAGVLHDAGRGPRLHRLRRRALQRRPLSGSTSPACPAARSAPGSTSRSTATSRWRPPSRSPARDGPPGRRPAAAWARCRSGRSTASSTTSSTRRAASNR